MGQVLALPAPLVPTGQLAVVRFVPGWVVRRVQVTPLGEE